ncbi:H-NS histone family protein [Alishewanella sp. BS5-314]|uniref:H-NS family histone-like protein n=1 Tax=Alishewanella sp. BS5-314 TaxID=2755587 RepID=UPI0021BAA9D3|nr:H-NS histone family protein [Alishewanella sp. BS5-314]MCT8124696.1 H-NS histone family protein [Alishewanella sp. BS5-314]
MSILLDKRELKKAAKELSLVKLQEVISTLNAVIAEREKEAEIIGQLEQLAKSQGFTLEQLGYKLSNDVISSPIQQDNTETGKRPVKPKFKTINKDKQYFYLENGQLNLLRTHTMKKGLQERGVEVVPVTKVDKKYAKQVDAIIAEATAQALENYNSKVDAWNEWAAVNGEEILSKK